MGEARDDGGPAFSRSGGTIENEHGAKFPEYGAEGMSLRDWFAGQQMMRIGSGWPNEDNMRLIAKNCYAMADAMLAERGNK